MDKTVVAGFCLAEDLDHLNTVDILYGRIIQRFRGINRVLVKVPAAEHHERIAEHTDRNGDKACQAHSPVDGKDVDLNDHRHQKVGRKLRHDMGQCRLDAVDPLDQGVL